MCRANAAHIHIPLGERPHARLQEVAMTTGLGKQLNGACQLPGTTASPCRLHTQLYGTAAARLGNSSTAASSLSWGGKREAFPLLVVLGAQPPIWL